MTDADKRTESALRVLENGYIGKRATPESVRGAVVSALNAFVSVREIGTSNTGYWIDKFHKEVGLRPGYPWCLMFVQYVYKLASNWFNLPDILPNNTAGTQALAAWAEKNGLCRESLMDVKPGDVIIWRDGSKSTGHTGSVVKSETKDGNVFTLTTIEGNTSSKNYRDGGTVAIKTYKVAPAELGHKRTGRWLRCIISFDKLYEAAI